MPRIPRLLVADPRAAYHVISRTALDGFVLGDAEKEHLLQLLQRLSRVYFAEIFGFCIMGNHFHLVVRMGDGSSVSDDEIRRRFLLYYGPDDKRQLVPEQIPALREKWASLSEFVKDLKQRFSRYYNRTHGRRGFFWGERFKSVIVENGDTLIHCLAYVDLNPVRAGIVAKPEDYRWSSLGYHAQTGNRDEFLSLDLGYRSFAEVSDGERLRLYRKFVYDTGTLPSANGAPIDADIARREEAKAFCLTRTDRLLYRTRHFTDSGVIGTKTFVAACYSQLGHHFSCRHDKKPHPIKGLPEIYSLKRLRVPS